jgi:predicted Zn-dependent protease
MCHPFQKSTGSLFCMVFMLSMILLASGQPAVAQFTRLPFSDPDQMFEQMFGEDQEEDRRALEKMEVSFEEERQLGQKLVHNAVTTLKEAGIKLETDGRDVEYLQSLVATLKPFMRNKMRYKSIKVVVAKSSRIDARSFPGGTLIFFEGLLDQVDNEAALIGIVGHELSHLDRGHQLFPIKRMKLMEKSLTSPQGMTDWMSSPAAMTRLWARPFRPEDERDADRDGVAWSFTAGYDPREMVKLFDRLSKKVGSSIKSDENAWAAFFRSHPNNQQRQDAIMHQFHQIRKKNPNPEPLFVGRENLIQRLSRAQAEK